MISNNSVKRIPSSVLYTPIMSQNTRIESTKEDSNLAGSPVKTAINCSDYSQHYSQKSQDIQTNVNVNQLLNPLTAAFYPVTSQYIRDDMRQVVSANQCTLVRSDMGTGKTYGMANVIADNMANGVCIIVTHLRSLVKGNQARLDDLLRQAGINTASAHYADNNDLDIADANVVFTTLHSLHGVIDKVGIDRVSLVMFDESESVAQIMTASIMDKSRENVANALDVIAASRCKVVMLDAHLDASTYAFCNAYLHGNDWALLDNRFTRWIGVEYQWIVDVEAGFLGNAEKAGISKLVDLLQGNQRVFVTSGSKSQAERIYNALKKLGLTENINVLKAWADKNHGDSPALTACKDSHDLFNNYQLVIATPAVGTGISIEPRNGIPCFDCVVSFITRHKDSPDAVSAMQMPFRVRKTTKNKIWLVACNFQPDSVNGLPEFVIKRDVKKQLELYHQLQTAYPDVLENEDIRRRIFGTYAGFAGALALHKADLWGRFFEVINTEFDRKGMVRAPDTSVEASDAVNDADKAAREEAKEHKFLDIYSASDINESQALAIDFKLKVGGSVSSDDRLSLKKYKLVRDYAPPQFDKQDMAGFRELAKLKDCGLMSGVKNIANAHLSLLQINAVQKAWTVSGHFRLDATLLTAQIVKVEWKLDRILCDVSGITCNDGLYAIPATKITAEVLTSKEAVGRWSYTRLIAEIIDGWNATHTNRRLSRKALQSEPLKLVGKLLASRLKLKVRVKNGFIAIDSEQPVIDLLNRHAQRGVIGLGKLIEVIERHDEQQASVQVVTKRDAVALIRQAWEQAGRPGSFATILGMFAGDMDDIEAENGYTIDALVIGIHAFSAAAG